MRHAREPALDSIDDLLQAIRVHPKLRERKRGAFYFKSVGFLHFHEDPAGMFADLKVGDSFERFAVNTPEEQQDLVARVAMLLAN